MITTLLSVLVLVVTCFGFISTPFEVTQRTDEWSGEVGRTAIACIKTTEHTDALTVTWARFPDEDSPALSETGAGLITLGCGDGSARGSGIVHIKIFYEDSTQYVHNTRIKFVIAPPGCYAVYQANWYPRGRDVFKDASRMVLYVDGWTYHSLINGYFVFGQRDLAELRKVITHRF